MKRIVLIAGSLFAVHTALAAGTASPPADSGRQTMNNEQARKELSDLRTQMQELSRRMAELSVQLGETGPRSYALRYLGEPHRAMIGVVLARDDHGVRISAVTPDGPAARAGLRDGDVITAIDGHSLDAKSPADSLQRARDLLGNLEENQKVTLGYRRGRQNSVAAFEAERRKPTSWARLFAEDPNHPLLPKDFDQQIRVEVERAQKEAELRSNDRVRADINLAHEEARKAMKNGSWRFVMPWWGLNLAPLNADLGRYFGADRGVLVLSADNHSLPGIRAGDVITRIAGESVSRPEDALRALRDQEPGKNVPIQVLRDRKTLALSMKAPEFNSIFNLREPPPAPPVPPAPPAPAAPAPAPAPSPAPAAAPAPPTPPAPPPEHPEHDDARS